MFLKCYLLFSGWNASCSCLSKRVWFVWRRVSGRCCLQKWWDIYFEKVNSRLEHPKSKSDFTLVNFQYLSFYLLATICITSTIDVSGIIEKFSVYATLAILPKDERNQQSFLISSYIYQNTKFLVIREKKFTLMPCLLKEFGSSTISHLFRKCLLKSAWYYFRGGWQMY